MMNSLSSPPIPSPTKHTLLLMDDNHERPAKAAKISLATTATTATTTTNNNNNITTCTETGGSIGAIKSDEPPSNGHINHHSDWVLEIHTVMVGQQQQQQPSLLLLVLLEEVEDDESSTVIHHTYNVHKATLAASSNYFSRLLQPQQQQQQEPTTTTTTMDSTTCASHKSRFEMPALMAHQFPQLLQFISAAAAAATSAAVDTATPAAAVTRDETLTITTETATALHSLAMKFGVDELCTQALAFIQRDLSLATMDRYHHDADVCHNGIVADMVLQFVTKHILHVPPSAAIVQNLTLEQWNIVLTNVYDVVVEDPATKTQVSCHLSELLAEFLSALMANDKQLLDLVAFQAVTAPDKIPIISPKAVVQLLETEQELRMIASSPTTTTAKAVAVPFNSDSKSKSISTLQTRCLPALVAHLIQQGTLSEDYATLFFRQSRTFLTAIIAQLTLQYRTFARTQTIKSQQIAQECEREVNIAKASRMDHLKAWKEAQQEIQDLKQRIASYEGSTAPATIASGTNARVTPPRQGSDPPTKLVLSSLDNEKR